MEWVIAAVVVVLLGLVALVATGRFGAMRETADRDVFAPVLPGRPLHPADLETVRFGVTLRGYAMNQVDDLLDRLAAELAQRDAELEQLRVELDLPADADPFAKYQLDGGQGVPAGGSWYDGDGHRSGTAVTAGFPQVHPEPVPSEVHPSAAEVVPPQQTPADESTTAIATERADDPTSARRDPDADHPHADHLDGEPPVDDPHPPTSTPSADPPPSVATTTQERR